MERPAEPASTPGDPEYARISSLIVPLARIAGIAPLLADVGLVILALGLIPPRGSRGGAAATG